MLKIKTIAILIAVLTVCASARQIAFSEPGPPAEAVSQPVAVPQEVPPAPAEAPEEQKKTPVEWRGGAPEAGTTDTTNSEGPGLVSTTVELFVYLGLILVLLAGCAMIFKRIFPSTKRMFNSDSMEVLGRTYLSSKQFVCLVRIGPRMLVLGCTPENVNALSEISDPEELTALEGQIKQATTGSATQTFLQIFRKRNLGYDEMDEASLDTSDSYYSSRVRSVRNEVDKLKSFMSSWRQKKT